MNIILTDEQKELVDKVISWYNDPSSSQTFSFSGPAGTGKSFILHYVVKALNLSETEIAPMSFTGASSLVLRRNGFTNAKTIHSSIYECVDQIINEPPRRGLPPKQVHYRKKFVFKGLDSNVKLIIIDEASMVPMYIRKDIDRCHVKVLACGDLNQLPAIKDEPAYLIDDSKIFKLTKIMRQAEGSAIVQLSRLLINGQPLRPGNYGEVRVIHRSGFERDLENYIKEYGIILCGTNKTRDHLNRIIREDICGIDSPLPIQGEKLICRKNHWEIEVDGINLVNGLYGVATSTPSVSSYCKDGYFTMNFRADFMEEEFKNLQIDWQYFKADIQTKRMMREDPAYMDYEKFEFAYAITTHVSQGSQFDSGIYLQEYFPNHSNNLNYTGLTRFRNKALYVIPDPRRKYWNFSKSPFTQCKTLIDVPKFNE